MNFLKKASLATAIAAISFAANAELVAMDEVSMAAATGQAGVDIDLTLTGTEALSIGSILYRDIDTDGGVFIDGFSLGAADGGTVTLYNQIDINADGSIVIGGAKPDGTQNVQNLVMSIGSIDTVTSDYVLGKDADGNNLAADGVNLMGASTIYMTLSSGTTTIAQVDADTTITMSGGSVEITSDGTNDTNVSLLNGAIGVKQLAVYGTGGKGTGISTDATLLFNGDGVSITNVNLAGTIEIGNLELGGSSIGSLAVSDIALNGAAITISGH
ncbi:MAG: hypothetical protein P1U57_10015 [Oleibacter sp.]|nr:hypothetical protein [Thalassolituus sp.]